MARIEFRAIKQVKGTTGHIYAPGALIPAAEWSTWPNAYVYIEHRYCDLCVDGELLPKAVAQSALKVYQRDLQAVGKLPPAAPPPTEASTPSESPSSTDAAVSPPVAEAASAEEAPVDPADIPAAPSRRSPKKTG